MYLKLDMILIIEKVIIVIIDKIILIDNKIKEGIFKKKNYLFITCMNRI